MPEGAVFHAASKRRRAVVFSAELRALTEQTVRQVRELIRSRRLPPAVLQPKCGGCSLHEICMPEVVSAPHAVASARRSLVHVEEFR